MQITYNAILERAEDTAKDYMPDLPKQDTIEAWESFQSELKDLDSVEIANESSEWDWVIYYHHAMEVCREVPGDVLEQAEDEWHEMLGPDAINENFGLYEMAGQLASIIVLREIIDAVERAKDELYELAENQLENLSA